MTSTQILDLLDAVLRAPMGFFWAGVAWLLDRLRGLGPITSGVLALLVLAAWVALAWFFQLRLRQRLGSPRTDSQGGDLHRLTTGEIARLEVSHSFLVLPVKPFQLLGRGLGALGRWIRRLFRRGEKTTVVEGDERARSESPSLVATLGPTFLLGGIATAVLYLSARAVEPLVAARLGLSEGLSFWQFLVFGHRPELSWYLPLERFPYLAGLLAVVFWLGVWSLAAVVARAVHWRHLREDLAWRGEDGRDQALAEQTGVLPFWRRWAGATELWKTDPSYRRWALWLVGASVPLLAWAWLSLGGDPYRIGSSELAVALVLWTSWSVHLLLQGKEPTKAEEAEIEDRPTECPHGWDDVLLYLAQHDHVERPEPFERWCLAPSPREPLPEDGPRLISPLVGQLLPGNGQSGHREHPGRPGPRLTPMQREVLTTLSLQGYVHSDPPRSPGTLTLGREAPDALEDRSGLRSRNLVVLAPEGTGKSTLALLAVANQALVHTRRSLVVVAGDGRAEAMARGFRRALDVTPLRWSVRVRSPGDDLMTDLSRGIVPDVVVADLRDLVVTLLDRSDSFEPFLRNLGLLVIDDVEAFTGPREVHGQLAFRRLVHRVEELLGVEELGGRNLAAPQVLILGTDGMHETSEWAQSLCGIDAVTRRYPEAPENGDGVPPRGGVEHRLHRLRDFRADSGELLSLETLIEACEVNEVPWHYRSCGDGRRGLGRGPLLLSEEPRHHTEDADGACVVFLEGNWSEVEREVQRLRRAGTAFARRRAPEAGEGNAAEPIGLVTVTDPDVEMAFTQLDREFVLTPTLATLPRPVFRPPTGRAVEPHLAADLTQHWTEVGDITRIFGDATAGLLRKLARQNLLQVEERTDVEPKVNEYVHRVHVRALARAVRGEEERDGDRGPTRALLPPRVGQVDLASPDGVVAVRDRASLVTLARVDAASAPFVYYPGRIFRDARGTFVVVGRASDEVERRSGTGRDDGGVVHKGDILVEPILTDAVSSPRRRLVVTPVDEERREELRPSAGGAFFGPDRVLLGREPIVLALEAVAIRVEHVATYRLGPVHGEVRQRTILDGSTRRAMGAESLETVALRLLPNPVADGDDPKPRKGAARSKKPEAPQLGLDEARLLTAAMRAVLPSMYRGGGESLGVTLRMEAQRPRGKKRIKGQRPTPEIDVYLFDSEAAGNGAARAIYRDGVDLLLRLCRLLVERVLSLDRLLALYDEWGDEEEILKEARAEAGGGKRAEDMAEERRKAHEERRHSLLAWLDSRLPPEGGAESQRDLARYFKSGAEQGEGDVIDLGRCWYSADGAVTDLLWAKHRWQHPQLGEVILDVGFDRKTYLAAKQVREDEGIRKVELDRYWEMMDGEDANGPSMSPQRVTCRSNPHKPCTKDPLGESLDELHMDLLGLAQHDAKSLVVLAGRLSEDPGEGAGSGAQRLAAFVQGIPNVGGNFTGPEEALPSLRTPVETVLERRGTCLSKALLLALLLERTGHQVGIFASLDSENGGAFAGVEAKGVPEAANDSPLWAELPRKGTHPGGRFVPIDITRARTIGEVTPRAPEGWSTWAFFPLAHLSAPYDEPGEGTAGDSEEPVDTPPPPPVDRDSETGPSGPGAPAEESPDG